MLRRSKFRKLTLAAVTAASTLYVSLGGACEWATTRFDPCGTLFANCSQGSFNLAFASVPDYDIDPTCTIPAGCVAPGTFESPFAQFGPGFEGP